MRLYNVLKNKYDLTKSELDSFISNHRILINGQKALLTSKVEDNDVLTIDDKIIDTNVNYRYFLFNKPKGVVCTNSKNEPSNIKEYINLPFRVFPIGRLDKDSHGLIILTNNQKICNKYLGTKNHIEKEYIVKLDKEYDETFIESMSKGVSILNTITKPCEVYKVDNFTFRIILREGLNRQIRRMSKSLGYNVVDLCRIRFGKAKLLLDEGNIKEIKLTDIE